MPSACIVLAVAVIAYVACEMLHTNIKLKLTKHCSIK